MEPTTKTTAAVRTDVLLGNIADAQVLVRMAEETFSERNEIFAGIFEMLGHKLTMIENTAKDLIEEAGVSA